jgi:ketosteroid isomerase-like protein
MNEESELTESVIRRFNSAINDHDIDAVMDLMSEDCIFENTFPAPDGTRHVGQSMVRKELGDFLLSSPLAYFQEEELIACGDRCVVRWLYKWGDGHVRGVDIMRVEDGKVSEKLSYVKG